MAQPTLEERFKEGPPTRSPENRLAWLSAEEQRFILWGLREQWSAARIGRAMGVHEATVRRFRARFWLKPKLGDNNAELINVVMGDVNKTMREDPTFIIDPGPPVCQLAIDLVEVSSEVELDREDLIGGVIIWNIIYRHDQDDPRRLYGQVP